MSILIRSSPSSRRGSLEKKYFRVLRWKYNVAAVEVSNEDSSPPFAVPKSGTPWLEVEEAIQAANAQYQGPIRIWNGYWRLLLKEALDGIREKGGLHKAEVYIGEVPDASFNASVRSFSRGRFLILVNLGLNLFFYRVARVIIASMRLRFANPEPDFPPIVEPQIDIGTARKHILRNLELLLDHGHELPIRLETSPAMWLSSTYTYAMQQFVIGHELGHIAYQLANKSNLPKHLRGKFGDCVNQEFHADYFATHVCQDIFESYAVRANISKDDASDAFFVAPYMLFPIMEALERMSRLRRRERDTHPPSELRRRHLLRLQESSGIPPEMKIKAEAVSAHMAELTRLF